MNSNIYNELLLLCNLTKKIIQNQYLCFVVPIFRVPQRNHVETEVVCSIPHKVSLLATGSQESTAKHPKKGVSISTNYKSSTYPYNLKTPLNCL